jgi:glycosyltransferase involved in cell wall biosynthesis
MPEFRPSDLCVVIPTRDRWNILERTLASLRSQTVTGFEVVVVVDGTDQRPHELDGARVIVKEHAGPGAARNLGARSTDRRLILLLGDDTIPERDLIERHVNRHIAEPAERVGVLGRIDWHPSCARAPVNAWMDWSGTQFDYAGIKGTDAGWGRFYSSNVSIKRSFLLGVGGFDEEFPHAAYEDLDLGYRLDQQGMVLLYEPAALALHDHTYRVAALHRRFAAVAAGEWLMISKHPDFPPYFANRIRAAESRRKLSAVWPLVVERIPASARWMRRRARDKANTWYLQQVADSFLGMWEGQKDLQELREYLGDDYDESLLRGHSTALDREFDDAADEETFYRTSQMYLYDLTVFAMTGTKRPYRNALKRLVPPGARLLDWGCGIGADGLRLLEEGYRVDLADFDNPSTEYLTWRLKRRGLEADVFDIADDDIPGGFDLAYSFDVIEHVDDPFAFLGEMERRARVVMVNLLEPDPHDAHAHKPLPITALLEHAERNGILYYRKLHGRSHVVAYRVADATVVERVRGRLRRLGGSARARAKAKLIT